MATVQYAAKPFVIVTFLISGTAASQLRPSVSNGDEHVGIGGCEETGWLAAHESSSASGCADPVVLGSARAVANRGSLLLWREPSMRRSLARGRRLCWHGCGPNSRTSRWITELDRAQSCCQSNPSRFRRFVHHPGAGQPPDCRTDRSFAVP